MNTPIKYFWSICNLFLKHLIHLLRNHILIVCNHILIVFILNVFVWILNAFSFYFFLLISFLVFTVFYLNCILQKCNHMYVYICNHISIVYIYGNNFFGCFVALNLRVPFIKISKLKSSITWPINLAVKTFNWTGITATLMSLVSDNSIINGIIPSLTIAALTLRGKES